MEQSDINLLDKLEYYMIYKDKELIKHINYILKKLETHDPQTGRAHSRNVAEIAREIAIGMQFSQKKIETVYLAGLVHDVGKICVPRNILNKRGRLSNEEASIIMQHPVWGYEILKGWDKLSKLARFVLYHHERWDGQGYPEGLAGNQIPIISQIIAVADAWNAMTSDRPYRAALSWDEAINELYKNKGSQFSPEVVEAFYQIIKEKEYDL
jgi:HD-GYP domain-containing protein (c-di-GMP phosphodiesterase class II)